MIEPGPTFDRYAVEALLGRGMGELYRAHDRKLDRRVALKVVHPHRGCVYIDPDECIDCGAVSASVATRCSRSSLAGDLEGPLVLEQHSRTESVTLSP